MNHFIKLGIFIFAIFLSQLLYSQNTEWLLNSTSLQESVVGTIVEDRAKPDRNQYYFHPALDISRWNTAGGNDSHNRWILAPESGVAYSFSDQGVLLNNKIFLHLQDDHRPPETTTPGRGVIEGERIGRIDVFGGSAAGSHVHYQVSNHNLIGDFQTGNITENDVHRTSNVEWLNPILGMRTFEDNVAPRLIQRSVSGVNVPDKFIYRNEDEGEDFVQSAFINGKVDININPSDYHVSPTGGSRNPASGNLAPFRISYSVIESNSNLVHTTGAHAFTSVPPISNYDFVFGDTKNLSAHNYTVTNNFYSADPDGYINFMGETPSSSNSISCPDHGYFREGYDYAIEVEAEDHGGNTVSERFEFDQSSSPTSITLNNFPAYIQNVEI